MKTFACKNCNAEVRRPNAPLHCEQCGQQRIVITDASKFTRTALVRVCGFDGLDLLVCDGEPPAPIQSGLAQGGARFEVAA